MLSSPEARGLVGASLSHLAPRVTRCPAPCSEHLWDEALLSWPASPTPRDSKMAQALVRRGCRGACAPLTQAAEHVTGFPLGLGVRDVPSPSSALHTAALALEGSFLCRRLAVCLHGPVSS